MSKNKWDFSGWATRTNIRCSDGRTIKRDAFKDCDGMIVPLVWNHRHNDPSEVLGHALLENRDEGVYTYGSFNDTEKGREAKELVKHGDITALSIYANHLTQSSKTPPCDVIHGMIREVSLVLAGANIGAYIENVMEHGELKEDEAEIFHGEDDDGLYLYHADQSDDEEDDDDEEDGETIGDILNGLTDKQKAAVGLLIQQVKKDSKLSHAEEEEADEEEDEEDDEDDETLGDIIKTLSPKQRKAVEALIGLAVSENKGENSDEEEDEDMKHNVFDEYEVEQGAALSHADMQQIFRDAKRLGSLKAAVDESMESGVLSHADVERPLYNKDADNNAYGIGNYDYLFPDARTINNIPEFISRDMGWVNEVINGTHHTPFSRVKSMFADITEDEARAKGYIKGKRKKEEVFTLLKRATDPQTIYKKQKMDRDDIIDITDFDVVAWIKGEMQMMMKEEIARAILIGDGRQSDSEEKISEAHVRPIYNDDDLFTVKVPVAVPANADNATAAEALMDAAIRSRKLYKGSGNPVFFTSEDWLTEMLLLKDDIGRKLYKSEAEVATALRVSKIVTAEVFEGQKIAIKPEGSETAVQKPFIGVYVNLKDYNVGADKGGATEFFEDFDIDYNQQKYLYETRMSGALIKPYSAVSFYLERAN